MKARCAFGRCESSEGPFWCESCYRAVCALLERAEAEANTWQMQYEEQAEVLACKLDRIVRERDCAIYNEGCANNRRDEAREEVRRLKAELARVRRSCICERSK